MNNIFLKDEKFYLKQIPYFRGIIMVDITRELKKSLRYQRLFLICKNGEYKVQDLAGQIGNISVSPEYDQAFLIVKTDSIIKKPVIYDEEDIRIIKTMIHYFCDIKPEITEKLCRAIGNNILSDYHCSFGLHKLAEFRRGLFEKSPIKIGNPEVLYYGRPRYNMLSLVKDFIETKDLQIFTDPELIGKYKRISRRTDDGSKMIRDKWAKFTGISGNRTRANISINTLSKVKVMIPKNEVGVESGERILTAIRSFALVVDGRLNMEEIGIKTSNTKLIGKLKRLELLEPMLFDGEYVVNLSKLPLFPKQPQLTPYQLGYAEFKVRESDIRLGYISLLLYRQEKKLEKLPRKIKEPEIEKTESTLFLEGLGIYGDFYYPGKVKTLAPEKTYKATEIIGKLSGIPSNLYPNLRDFINIGSCKNAVIQKALEDLAGLKEENKIEILKENRTREEIEKKERVNYLRFLKYRVISGKTLTLSGNNQLERTKVNVKGVNISWIVKETEIEI